MKHSTQFAVLCILVIACVFRSWAGDKETLLIKLDGQGKTLSVSNNGDRAGNIRIEISAIEGHTYKILYNFYDQVFDPIPLADERIPGRNGTSTPFEAIPDQNGFCDVTFEKGTRFFIYNIIDDTTIDIIKKVSNRTRVRAELRKDQKTLQDEDTTLAEITANWQAVKDKIDICKKTTIKEWPRELNQMDSFLEQLYARKASLEKECAEGTECARKLRGECDRLGSELKLIDQLANEADAPHGSLNGICFYSILKVGGLILGQNQKTIYFDLQDEVDQPLLLSRLGNYPTLTQDDLIYALIINRVPARNPGPFYLFVKAESQPISNPTPVRPVFAAPAGVIKGLRAPHKAVYYHAGEAYYDSILPFGQKFNGGDVLEITISSYAEVVTVDKETTGDKPEKTKTIERKLVDLIKEVKLPQVRTLYRFNVTPGLILSALRDHEYYKVKTASDDPLTKDINEARYRIDDVRGGWRAFPTLAFTLYLKRVDIQERPGLGEILIPNPTVALALNSLDPSKNLFFGFMHEFPVRNTHLFYGLHVGQTTELVKRNEVDEDRNDIAPLTRQRTKLGFFVGLSFNLDWLTSIFKK